MRWQCPDAIIVYIHLWLLKALVQDAKICLEPNINAVGPELTLDWKWVGSDGACKFHPKMAVGMDPLITDMGKGMFMMCHFLTLCKRQSKDEGRKIMGEHKVPLHLCRL